MSAKSQTKKLFQEIEEIKKKEDLLLKEVESDLHKDIKNKKKLYFDVVHLSFNDFAQVVIGTCVFGLPAFINTSFWDYLVFIETGLLFYIHLFFILMVLLALNYEFRDNMSINLWFLKFLLKRFFYTYFSVMMVVCLLLVLVAKVTYNFSVIDVFRHFLAAQSVGMFGAVTYSFLKK